MTLDKNEKRWAAWAALGILVLIALYFWRRYQLAQTNNGTTQPVATPSTQPTLYSTTPGIPDNYLAYNGQPSPVNTLASIYYNIGTSGTLANQLIPLYGLVGFGVGPGVY
jgi:hypothetical protein